MALTPPRAEHSSYGTRGVEPRAPRAEDGGRRADLCGRREDSLSGRGARPPRRLGLPEVLHPRRPPDDPHCAICTRVAADKIDIVRVHEVDRLTRSLDDFAKCSTGTAFRSRRCLRRLPPRQRTDSLEVLSSFAQLEREETHERIRDKFSPPRSILRDISRQGNEFMRRAAERETAELFERIRTFFGVEFPHSFPHVFREKSTS